MGQAVATAALRRGAEVILISGPTTLTPPAGAVYVPVQTAEDMREAAFQHLERATIVIKAAAVADYRVKQPSATKIKSRKDEAPVCFNPDSRRSCLVGFAAETNDVRANAAAKLQAKGVDLLVANDVSVKGIGFDAEDNQVTLLDRWGGAVDLPKMSKLDVADAILDRVVGLRAADRSPASDRAAH
jgi:phosphopantothenoylcysteine decarboxylase/phosphopantothenate--cysteine ligase